MTTNPDDKKPKQVLATYAVVALIVMFLLNIFVLPGIMERSIRETTYSDFLKGIDSKQIQEVQFDVQDSIIYYTLKQDGKTQVKNWNDCRAFLQNAFPGGGFGTDMVE